MLLFYEAITRATQAAVSELSGAGRVGAAAAAQPVLAARWSRRSAAGATSRASSGPISRPISVGRRAAQARPSSASRRSPRRWRGTWRCWPDPAGRASVEGRRVSRQSGGHGDRGGTWPLFGRHSALAVRRLASNLAAGLEMIHLRQDRDRFGPAEGVLQSPRGTFVPGGPVSAAATRSPRPSWSVTPPAPSGSSWSGCWRSSRSKTWPWSSTCSIAAAWSTTCWPRSTGG